MKTFRETRKEIIVITKFVDVVWGHSNKKFYTSLGYEFTRYGDRFQCLVSDLSCGSRARIEVQCPVCERERTVVYQSMLRWGHSLCNACVGRADITGMKFGRLTALKINEDLGKVANWICECECGNIVPIAAGKMISGNTTSCGCYHDELKRALCRERHPNWNPNLTDEERLIGRRTTEYRRWRSEVYRRDRYVCQCCGKRKSSAHHLYSYSDYPEHQLDTNNGVSLCELCHGDFHINFMGNTSAPCTPEDYLLWILTKDIIPLTPPLRK